MASVGAYSIINTSAVADHDDQLGKGVHLMPGATLCGEIVVEDFATIGANATVLPRLRIGSGAFVGAGAVVTRDVPPGATVVGVPARIVDAQ
jgi:acetyltransferase-like isoleucine patch superfamily enzyme